MYKLVLLVLGLFILTGVASGYQINIDAPATLTVGKPLVVNGTTNFGIGTPIDVVLYHQLTSTTEIKRKIAYVQSDHTFRVVFDTTQLEKGIYKVEVPASGLGQSVNMRQVELVDRTDEISLNTGINLQEFTGIMKITGTLKNNKNAGIQIEVTAPEGERIFGPKFIPTDSSGIFTLEIPITGTGDYEVGFTDTQGYIGSKTITITGGTPNTMVATGTMNTRLSAHAPASREAPAYFEVKAGSGAMKVYTSSDVNWVIEYGNASGFIVTVNDHGEVNPEEIEIAGNGSSVFFKIYPYQGSGSNEVFLYAENARSIRVSPTVPALFQQNTVLPGSETQAPLATVTVFGAFITIVILFHIRH